MKLGKLLCVVFCVYAFQGYAVRHSDAEMRAMIGICDEALKDVKPDNKLIGDRCPYENQSEEFKLDIIKDGYEQLLYSDDIRKELIRVRKYPMIIWSTEKRYLEVKFLCKFGCFATSTEVLVGDSSGLFTHVRAGDITYDSRLAGLRSDDFFSEARMVPKGIESIIKGREGEWENLLNFQLSNGASLKVTVNHGMVLSDGRVVASQDVKDSDVFVGYGGELVNILQISEYSQNKGVINFRLKGSKEGHNHIMGAEGVLVGDHAWQDDMEDDLNGIAIRRAAIQ